MGELPPPSSEMFMIYIQLIIHYFKKAIVKLILYCLKYVEAFYLSGVISKTNGKKLLRTLSVKIE